MCCDITLEHFTITMYIMCWHQKNFQVGILQVQVYYSVYCSANSHSGCRPWPALAGPGPGAPAGAPGLLNLKLELETPFQDSNFVIWVWVSFPSRTQWRHGARFRPRGHARGVQTQNRIRTRRASSWTWLGIRNREQPFTGKLAITGMMNIGQAVVTWPPNLNRCLRNAVAPRARC